MNAPSKAMVAAFGRHVVSYSMGAITSAAAFHAISSDQANALTGAIQSIVSGVTSIAGGVATIVSVGAALYAAWTATAKKQAQSLVNTVPGTTVVTTPEIAAATPGESTIVSRDIAQVVRKVGT